MFLPWQQQAALLAPLIPLRFLVRPECRARKPQTADFAWSDSAYFHRLRDVVWTFCDAETVALLNDDERAALDEFNRVFTSLPWQVVEAYPFIKELPDDDLSPLIPAGEKLLRLLEVREARLGRFRWLRRLFGSGE